MTHFTCRLTAKNRDLLTNPALGNRVWATFTFFTLFFGEVLKDGGDCITQLKHEKFER